jgi:hypothetical protein
VSRVTDTVATRRGRFSGEGGFVRPGVKMPERSVVTSDTARRALDAIFSVAGREVKWTGLDTKEDRLLQAILKAFASSGQPPDVSTLASATGLPADHIRECVQRLRARDLVVSGDDGNAIAAAYPFCAWTTGHRVSFENAAVNSLCAIDALGIGAMLDRDTSISSVCRECGRPISIATQRQGTALRSVSPIDTVVWAGMAYEGNCGATSSCTQKVFFCCDADLEAWTARQPRTSSGFRLSLDEAHQIARAIFAPMLRPSAATSTITCPSCGTKKIETMPIDACQFFYDCTGCGTILRPKSGDCCVFCSYGDVPCPPVQQQRSGRQANCCA